MVLVSACYSGVFVGPSMQKKNRIILTAARQDRTSFGCSAENEYTYWDSCLIARFAEVRQLEVVIRKHSAVCGNEGIPRQFQTLSSAGVLRGSQCRTSKFLKVSQPPKNKPRIERIERIQIRSKFLVRLVSFVVSSCTSCEPLNRFSCAIIKSKPSSV